LSDSPRASDTFFSQACSEFLRLRAPIPVERGPDAREGE
jgi:hypothetical protein